jgi:hypothetical protein
LLQERSTIGHASSIRKHLDAIRQSWVQGGAVSSLLSGEHLDLEKNPATLIAGVILQDKNVARYVLQRCFVAAGQHLARLLQ